MAYSEVIKNFNRVRDYLWEFYVYGFKSHDEYTKTVTGKRLEKKMFRLKEA